MTREPKPHQQTAATFLADRGFAYLADEPGLGKTYSVVLAADKIEARRILVFCPAVVRQHWAREFSNWQTVPRKVDVVEGRPKKYTVAGVTVVSHDSLANADAVSVLMAGYPYDLIVVDEAHVFRSFTAARTRTLLQPGGVWSWASRFWCLSGTPMVNSAADLWPFVYGPLRTPIDWLDFCKIFTDLKTTMDGPKPTGIKQPDVLADQMRPHFLHRTLKSIGMALPHLLIEPLAVDVPQAALTQVMADLEGWNPDRLSRALGDQDELRDSAMSRVRRVLGIAKAPAVAAHVEGMLSRGEGPVVVFFQHTDVRNLLHAELSGKCGRVVSWIDGHVTPTQLNAAEAWLQDRRLDVLLVQTQAGGVGLTLTTSNRVVIAELPWTAVALWQAVKRCHRIGQTRAVRADVVRSKDVWLEEILASVVGRKHKASEELLSRLVSRF